MELEDVSNEFENRICYLLATSDAYIDEISCVYQRGLLSGKYYSLFAKLCLAYYKKFKQAPKDKLNRFLDNASVLNKLSADDRAELKLIVESFANEKECTDIDFEISETFNYFQATAINLVSKEAQELTNEGRIEEAKSLLAKCESFDRGKVSGTDVYALSDSDIESTVNETYEQLITLPGALGKVMNNTLVRGGFITFVGRMKSGKTYNIMELCRYARNQGERVILFSAGDMTQNQMIMRVWQADARTTSNKYYQDMQRIPYLDCKRNQIGMCMNREGSGNLLNDFKEVDPYIKDDNKEYKPCTKCANSSQDKESYDFAITYRKVRRPILDSGMVQRLRDKWLASGNKGVLHIEHAPSGTLTVAKRRAIIRSVCKKYGWDHPDVIAYDYAGILAQEKGDERESTHYIWQTMRAEADPEMFDCLVITAMQSNSTSFNFEDLTIRSFSLDKRCFDEVSAAFAINCTPEERKNGITRIAALLKREHPFDESMQAECYGCLALGTPWICSRIVFREPPKPLQFSK